MAEVKCSRTICKRKTKSPQTNNWTYMDEAPDYVPHWIGWWCPKCIKELHKMLKAQGIKPIIERPQ